jgi:hypothetical protein
LIEEVASVVKALVVAEVAVVVGLLVAVVGLLVVVVVVGFPPPSSESKVRPIAFITPTVQPLVCLLVMVTLL